tara:strand:- start:1179 stop:1685 length:507 start_codon:yes stop_codon:yes gene_type:complete
MSDQKMHNFKIGNDKLFNLLNSKTCYKWNINKKLAYFFALTIIKKILSERNNNIIRLDELTQLINKRYKETNDFIIKKNKKPKSLYNFIKLEFNGIEYFIENYLFELCKIYEINNIKQVKQHDSLNILNNSNTLNNKYLKKVQKNLKDIYVENEKLQDWYFVTNEDIK